MYIHLRARATLFGCAHNADVEICLYSTYYREEGVYRVSLFICICVSLFICICADQKKHISERFILVFWKGQVWTIFVDPRISFWPAHMLMNKDTRHRSWRISKLKFWNLRISTRSGENPPFASGFVRGSVLLKLVNSLWKMVSQLILTKMFYAIYTNEWRHTHIYR